MRILKRFIILLLLALTLFIGVIFSIHNTAVVPLDLVVVQLPEQRIALWVLAAFALGGITGIGISTYTIVRLKGQSLLLRRQLVRSHKEQNQQQSQNTHLSVTKN